MLNSSLDHPDDDLINFSSAEQQLSEPMSSTLVIRAEDPIMRRALAEDHQNNRPEEANHSLNLEDASNHDDDLIPSTDPCYKNLNLRNRSVELLRLVTARTILGFVLSLLEGEEILVSDPNDPESLNRSTLPATTRQSIIHSVERNQDSFARHSRSETQIIIGQCLFKTRAKIIDDFEQNHHRLTTEDEEDERLGLIEEGLKESNVSRLVEEELLQIISKDFTNYSYEPKPNDRSCSLLDPSSLSINLIDVSNLVSFSGKVFYWNKFFDLILPPRV